MKRSGTGVRRGSSRKWERRSEDLEGRANCRWARCWSERLAMNWAAGASGAGVPFLEGRVGVGVGFLEGGMEG